MSASNVYAVYKSATGQLIDGRTRMNGVYFTHSAGAAGTIQFYNGTSDTDPLILELATTTVADSQNFVIPEQGILFKNGCYAKFGATVTSVTILAEGGAPA